MSKEFHGLRAVSFQHVALAVAPRTFFNLQEFHGLRAAPFQTVALDLAPRTFARVSLIPMIRVPEWCVGRIQDYAGTTVMLIRCAEVQKWRPGTILDRQGTAVRLTRGVEIPSTMFWHASGSSKT
eukprot:4321342-Pyramimonas_sp.AAC.1